MPNSQAIYGYEKPKPNPGPIDPIKEDEMGIAGDQSNILQGQAPAVPPPAPPEGEAQAAGNGFNTEAPWDYTIAAIQEHVTANPGDATAIRDAEQGRGDQARTTLLSWLNEHISAQPTT